MFATQTESVGDDKYIRSFSRFWMKMSAPVDIAPLVYFRVFFGAILLWEVFRYFDHGWIERYYTKPTFFFKYLGFEWVHPWPGGGMYLHFFALGVVGACIMLGLFYRVSTVLFFFGFTYVFLLDQANHLNHFYLIILTSFLLIFLPANQAVSLDAWRRPDIRNNSAPGWTVWLLRFQIAVPYFYGGIAKLNYDWLHGEPVRGWLAKRPDFPLIGSRCTEDWVVYALSYGGLLFDLLIVPLLLWRKTRWVGAVWLLAFHFFNSQFFGIGIFPWFMLFATPVFFPPEWFRRVLRCFVFNVKGPNTSESATTNSLRYPRILACSLSIFVVFQCLFPLRHLLYPGNPSWTEEGHRFAWHMKLRDKDADAQFVVSDRRFRQTWIVDPHDYLTKRQRRKMPNRPDMILQFSHFLADRWRRYGYEDVEVYALVNASLNGRRYQALVDPKVDLSKQRRSLLHSPWIVDLKEPLKIETQDRRTMVGNYLR